MVTSNLLQPLTLFFNHNIVTHTRAVIFVSTNCKGLPYLNTDYLSKSSYKLLTDLLEFQNIDEICQDFSKEQIIEKLASLKEEAVQFEKE